MYADNEVTAMKLPNGDMLRHKNGTYFNYQGLLICLENE